MINNELIESRMKFLGYGDLESDIWFIGMEEACEDEKDVIERLNSTEGKEIIDNNEDMKTIKVHMKWFEENTKIQPTWKKLICILLNLNLDKKNDDEIRKFQIGRLGRKNKNHCILELMPLPSKSLRKKDWFYPKISNLKYLESRKNYMQEKMNTRIDLIKEKIEKHKPKNVIFYGTSKKYFECWEKIIGYKFKKEKEKNIYEYKQGKIQYFIMKHPVAHGIKNEDWNKVILSINNKMQKIEFC